jgi:hypothetical protein
MSDSLNLSPLTDNMSEQPIPPTIQQLQQQVAELQAYLSSLQHQNQIQPPLKGIKVAPPDTFDGIQSQTDSFLSQLALYFTGKRRDFQDDQDKIIFALSYMKGGTAGPWAAEIVRQYQVGTPVYESWESFREDLLAAFGDPDPASTARFKMDQLKQGNHPVEEYVASFKALTSKTKYNDAAHVEKFERGLNSALVDKIYSLPEMPTTLAGWMAWATKLDRQWRQREARKKTVGSPPTPRQFKPITPPSRTPQAAKEPDVVPMEIDSGRKRIGPLICYKCRKPGHIARNCQSPVDIRVMDYEAIKALVKEDLKNQESQKEGF